MRKGDDLTTFVVPKVEKIRSLNLRIPRGLLRPVAGKLYLYLYWTAVHSAAHPVSALYQVGPYQKRPSLVPYLFRIAIFVLITQQLRHSDSLSLPCSMAPLAADCVAKETAMDCLAMYCYRLMRTTVTLTVGVGFLVFRVPCWRKHVGSVRNASLYHIPLVTFC